MITYDQRRLAGIPLLWKCMGSMFPRAAPPACLAALFTLTLKLLRHYEHPLPKVFSHPFPYQFYTFLLGFMLVFRTTLTYQRFWEGRTQLETMTSKCWLLGLLRLALQPDETEPQQ